MTDEQWQAIQNRDSAYDELFLYALTSTGTVCRPSCPSRTPNPKNVVIFHDLLDALRLHYRPCKRCRPDSPAWCGAKAELAQKAKAYINEHYTDRFTLHEMAHELYINGFYLLRAFAETIGCTPLQYLHQVRIAHAARLLDETDMSVSDIGYEVGYNTLSHFSRIFKSVTKLSPVAYRTKKRTHPDDL